MLSVNLTVYLLVCRYTLLHRSCARQCSICMEMGCLVMVGQLKGMGTRLLDHHVKKGNMMVVIIGLD